MYSYISTLQGDHGGLRLVFIDFNTGSSASLPICHAISAQSSAAQAEISRQRNKDEINTKPSVKNIRVTL